MLVTGNHAWKQGQEGVLELKGGWLEWQTVVVGRGVVYPVDRMGPCVHLH